MNMIFKTSHMLSVAILLSLTSLSGTAHATTQSEAVKLCNKNPSCSHASDADGVNLWGKGKNGKTYEIYCPNKGKCQIIIARAAGGSVRGILLGKFNFDGENGQGGRDGGLDSHGGGLKGGDNPTGGGAGRID
jgi:hypothetical protein